MMTLPQVVVGSILVGGYNETAGEKMQPSNGMLTEIS